MIVYICRWKAQFWQKQKPFGRYHRKWNQNILQQNLSFIQPHSVHQSQLVHFRAISESSVNFLQMWFSKLKKKNSSIISEWLWTVCCSKIVFAVKTVLRALGMGEFTITKGKQAFRCFEWFKPLIKSVYLILISGKKILWKSFRLAATILTNNNRSHAFVKTCLSWMVFGQF